MNAERESLPQDTTELLRRILNAVESAKPKHGFEIACAIVLALATTASAWCAYQSKLWGGAQMARANLALSVALNAISIALSAATIRSQASASSSEPV